MTISTKPYWQATWYIIFNNFKNWSTFSKGAICKLPFPYALLAQLNNAVAVTNYVSGLRCLSPRPQEKQNICNEEEIGLWGTTNYFLSPTSLL